MVAGQPTKRIGELLVDRRLITRAQLEQALLTQRSTKEFLGVILVRMGFVKPDTLLAALSEQFKIPCESLRPEQVDWQVIKQFPRSALSEGKCIPIRADTETVTVAIANPLDAWTLSTIEQAAGFRKVQVVLVLERELQAILQEYQRRALHTIEEQFKDHGGRQS